jgi:predicted metal-dependent hydrolase
VTLRNGRPKRAGVRDEQVVLQLGAIKTTLHVRRHPHAHRTSLRISADGSGVLLVIPKRGRLQDGVAVARAHADWICDRLAALPERVPFAHGAVLPVMGTDLTVRQENMRRPGVRRDGDTLVVGGPDALVAPRIETWLRRTAHRELADRSAGKAERLGRQPTAIAVRDTRSRWGSCSSAGVLSFSWRLVLAPPLVLDYVVAHEVAHLLHRGHGPEFWETVGQLTENAERGRAWLRRDGTRLFRYG